MSGTFKGNNSFCSHDVNTTVVWYADKWFLQRNLSCWGYMMSLEYDAKTNRWAEGHPLPIISRAAAFMATSFQLDISSAGK